MVTLEFLTSHLADPHLGAAKIDTDDRITAHGHIPPTTLVGFDAPEVLNGGTITG
jgi:hypothetical protein